MFWKRTLKKAVLCPYHQEKTGSMVIDFADNTFRCYGCGTTGKIEMTVKFIPDNGHQRFIKYETR